MIHLEENIFMSKNWVETCTKRAIEVQISVPVARLTGRDK